jgi:hypothetical protein
VQSAPLSILNVEGEGAEWQTLHDSDGCACFQLTLAREGLSIVLLQADGTLAVLELDVVSLGRV